MIQPDLFLDAAWHARARDPHTSHAAARRVGEFANRHHYMILAALEISAMTVAEIARATGLQEQQVNKRTAELERKGAIRTTGATRKGPSGRAQRVWTAK